MNSGVYEREHCSEILEVGLTTVIGVPPIEVGIDRTITFSEKKTRERAEIYVIRSRALK
ncbi:hypothetical protein FRC03_008171 [Tulasnella sp. 419]|nr:hypothetical protein FRC03_008171 [Tulasnella sp. 419]